MEKYVAVEEVVELFNGFTQDKDPTIGGILWVGAENPTQVVVRKGTEYGRPMPSVMCFRTEWDLLSKISYQGGNMASQGYRQEDVLSVEFHEYSTGSRIRWGREPHEVIGRLEYFPGENPEGFYDQLLQKFMEVIDTSSEFSPEWDEYFMESKCSMRYSWRTNKAHPARASKARK